MPDASVELLVGAVPASITDLNPLPTSTPPSALRLDYAGRTDSQPVYLGKAPPASTDAAAVWSVTRLTYESGADAARLVASDVRADIAWPDRTTPTPPWS